MSLLAAALHELELRRDACSGAIESLRALVEFEKREFRTITVSGEIAPVPRRSEVRPERRTKAPAPPAPLKATPTPAASAKAGPGLPARILALLQARQGSMKSAEIVDALKAHPWPVKQALRELASQRLVALTGKTTSARWSAVESKAHAKPATDDPVVETVWSGTKERTGEAPTLVGSYPRKGA
jgi:hypothetical protein